MEVLLSTSATHGTSIEQHCGRQQLLYIFWTPMQSAVKKKKGKGLVSQGGGRGGGMRRISPLYTFTSSTCGNRGAHNNWSMVICQGSTRSELP